MATNLQTTAFNKLVENGGFVKQAMIDAKYKKTTAKTPQKLTESKGFQKLLKERIPDNLLTNKLLMLIKHKDWRAVADGLNKAFKLKGYENVLPQNATFNQYNFSTMTDEQLDRVIKSIETGTDETQSQE